MKKATIIKPTLVGISGTLGLLGIYVSVLTAVSGWDFVVEQFLTYWHFIVSLAVGFGVQIGLYSYLRSAVKKHCASGKVVAVSGTTSTAAMISCCAHYLTNILPVIGVAGLVTVISQYQLEIFWLGLASNLAGVIYMARKVIVFARA